VAIVFMHAYSYPAHEQQVAALARDMGFTQVSVSHEVSPLIKLVSRGDTTVVDAYLSPLLRRYVRRVAEQLATGGDSPSPRLRGEGRGEGDSTQALKRGEFTQPRTRPSHAPPPA